MKSPCDLFEDALSGEDPAAVAAAEDHAATCPSCRTRLRTFEAISAEAVLLRKSWDSPDLWPKIESALKTQAGPARGLPGLRLLAAAAALLAVAFGVPFLFRSSPPSPDRDRFLTERALRDVERSETEYKRAIERLSKLAEPRLEAPKTPLLAATREKLDLLDAAISDCRAQIDQNRFNAQLRLELLEIYREKKKTLEQLMGDET